MASKSIIRQLTEYGFQKLDPKDTYLYASSKTLMLDSVYHKWIRAMNGGKLYALTVELYEFERRGSVKSYKAFFSSQFTNENGIVFDVNTTGSDVKEMLDFYQFMYDNNHCKSYD